MKRLTLLLVLLALLLAACDGPQVPSEPTQPTTEPTAAPTEPTVPQIDSVQSGPVKLTNVGTFEHVNNLMFAYGDFVLLYHRDHAESPYQLLSPLGSAALTGLYNAASYCGNGIALVSQPGESYDPVGLVDYRTGTVLAACEALRVMQLSQRYYVLTYVENTVASEEDAFSFYMDKNGGVIYFAGCARILDAASGSFVPELKLDAMPDELGVFGEGFYIRSGETVTVYNADGTEALSLEGGIIHDGVALHPTFGGVSVYGSDLQLVAQLKHASQRLTIVDGGYLRFYDNGSYQLLDLQGNVVVEDVFEDIACVTGNLIVAQKETGWGITALTGEELLSYTYTYIEACGDGKLLLEDAEGKLMLYAPDGTLTDITDLSGDGWYRYGETDSGRQYLLQNGNTLALGGEVSEMDLGLVSTEEGLYELYTGGTLLSGYDRYAYCDGYVYARMYGIWTVFQVEITQ